MTLAARCTNVRGAACPPGRKAAQVCTVAMVLAVAVVSPAAAQTPSDATPSPAAVDPGRTVDTGSPSSAVEADRPAAGWWDLEGRVREAINDWLTELTRSALAPVLELLGRTVLSTPQVAGPGRVADLWRISRGLVDTAFVLFVLAGGVIVMSHETVQTRYTVKDIAPRLVLAIVAANLSLWVAGQAIAIANALSVGLLGEDVAVGDLAVRVDELLAAQAASGGTALLAVGVVAAVLAVVVVAVYVLRVAVVVLVVASGPLALACHALPQTDPVARLWWRALVACLAVQVGQALVVIAAVRVFFAPDDDSMLGLDDGTLLGL